MKQLEKYPKPAAMALTALILLAAALVYRTLTGADATEAALAYQDSVSEQARQTASYLKRDVKVVVLAFDTEARSINSAPLERIIDTLKHEGLSIRHVERLVRDEAKGWKELGGFPYAEFLRVVEEHPKADAVVSLCGVPYLDAEADLPDPASLPPLLVPRAVGKSSHLARLLAEGRVAMVVVARETAPSETEGSDHDLFDRNFQVLTSAVFSAQLP